MGSETNKIQITDMNGIILASCCVRYKTLVVCVLCCGEWFHVAHAFCESAPRRRPQGVRARVPAERTGERFAGGARRAGDQQASWPMDMTDCLVPKF